MQKTLKMLTTSKSLICNTQLLTHPKAVKEKYPTLNTTSICTRSRCPDSVEVWVASLPEISSPNRLV